MCPHCHLNDNMCLDQRHSLYTIYVRFFSPEKTRTLHISQLLAINTGEDQPNVSR